MGAHGTTVEMGKGRTAVRTGLRREGSWTYVYSDLTVAFEQKQHHGTICLCGCTLTIVGDCVSWDDVAGDGWIVLAGERLQVVDGVILR